MGTITRTRLLLAAFSLSLCGLGVTAGMTQRAQVNTSGTVIIDDGDTGFTQTSNFKYSAFKGAYNGDTAYYLASGYLPTGTTAQAEWKFSGLAQGTYDVYATWKSYQTFSKTAVYRVMNGTTQTSSDTTVDQSKEPASATIDGRAWQLLGNVSIGTANDVVVTMKPGVSGFSVADAVMVRKRAESDDSPPPPSHTCGNTIVETGEQCDDGNNSPLDACYRCANTTCGDRFVQASRGEQCDFGEANGTQLDGPLPAAACDASSCKLLVCGDGIRTEWIAEQCDDGNTENGDGCSYECKTEEPVTLCPTGYACTRILQQNQCGGIAVNCPQGQQPETVGTCGTASCQGTCFRCVPIPQEPAQLNVAVKNIGTTGTVTRNQQNVTLLRFEARATGEDVLLTKMIGQAAVGNLLNAEKYTLWVDTDGEGTVDTVLQNLGTVQNGIVTFDQLQGGGYVVPKDETVAFEIRADIAATPVNNTLQLDLATATSAYVAAETLDDGETLAGIKTNAAACPAASCAIIVTTTPSKLYTIVQQADLFVILDSTPTRARQLLGGTLSEPILRIELRAQNENAEVTTLRFVTVGGTAAGVDLLELYKDGTATPFATATVGACADFSVSIFENNPARTLCATMNSQQLVVQNGQSADVLVRARMKTDVQGAVSGDPVQLAIDTSAGGGGQVPFGFVEARGVTSSAQLSQNDGDTVAEGEIFIGTSTPGPSQIIRGVRHVTVLSKIASIVNANPDQNGTSVPTGTHAIGQFTFTAAQNANTRGGNNAIFFPIMTFTVAATNVQLNMQSFKIYDKAVPNRPEHCQAIGEPNTPNLIVVCQNPGVINTLNLSLNNGESKTFVLEATVTSPSTSGTERSSLQVSLRDFSDPTATQGAIPWRDYDFAQEKTYQWIESVDAVINGPRYESEPSGAVCGNGTVENVEQCDDGNLANGDGCNHQCQITNDWWIAEIPSIGPRPTRAGISPGTEHVVAMPAGRHMVLWREHGTNGPAIYASIRDASGTWSTIQTLHTVGTTNMSVNSALNLNAIASDDKVLAIWSEQKYSPGNMQDIWYIKTKEYDFATNQWKATSTANLFFSDGTGVGLPSQSFRDHFTLTSEPLTATWFESMQNGGSDNRSLMAANFESGSSGVRQRSFGPFAAFAIKKDADNNPIFLWSHWSEQRPGCYQWLYDVYAMRIVNGDFDIPWKINTVGWFGLTFETNEANKGVITYVSNCKKGGWNSAENKLIVRTYDNGVFGPEQTLETINTPNYGGAGTVTVEPQENGSFTILWKADGYWDKTHTVTP